MSIAQRLDATIAQLQSLRESAEALDGMKAETTAAESKVSDLERQTNALEQSKAKLLRDIEELKHQVEVLRAEKVQQRKERQEAIDEARANLNELNSTIVAAQGQQKAIAAAIAELKGRLG